MESLLSLIQAAILEGKLHPDEVPLADEILERYGVETFLAFLTYRPKVTKARQFFIDEELGDLVNVLAKHTH